MAGDGGGGRRGQIASGSWRAGLGWTGHCNTGWLGRADKAGAGGLVGHRTRSPARSSNQRRPAAPHPPCVRNCAKVIWDSSARRPLQMRWSLPAPKANCRACEPSGACSTPWRFGCRSAGASLAPRRLVSAGRGSGDAELDAFDVIEDLRWKRAKVDVLTSRALWGSVCGAWVSATLRARWLCERLEAIAQHGCPAYASSTTIRASRNAHPSGCAGQVIRCCLSLGVTLSLRQFGNMGRKISMRAYHLWQQKVWQRFQHASPAAFQATSDRSWRLPAAPPARDDQSPTRRAFPKRWQLICNAVRRTLIYCAARITKARSRCWTSLAVTHCGAPLVRAEVDLEANQIRCYRLRRRAGRQPWSKLSNMYSLKTFSSHLTTSDVTPIFTLPLTNINDTCRSSVVKIELSPAPFHGSLMVPMRQVNLG